MSDQTLSEDLAETGQAIEQNELDATRAAMSAAASEFSSQLNAETAQAAAQLATAAALDTGKLDAILSTLGRIDASIQMLAQPPAAQDYPPVIVIETEQAPDEQETAQDDPPGDEGESSGVEVENAQGVPPGRQKSKRGLFGPGKKRG